MSTQMQAFEAWITPGQDARACFEAGWNAALSQQAPVSTEAGELPPLSQHLIYLINEYGFARTDNYSEGARLRLWGQLIDCIEDYARSAIAQSRAQVVPAEPVAPMLDDEGLQMIVNSPHYTAENIRAIISDLKECEQGAEVPEWVYRDHRGRCGVWWRVIAALASDVPIAAPAVSEPTEPTYGPWIHATEDKPYPYVQKFEAAAPIAPIEPTPPAAHVLPESVLTYIHAYGDARADDDGTSATRLAEAILAMRRWVGTLVAPAEPTPPAELGSILEEAAFWCDKEGAPDCWSAAEPTPELTDEQIRSIMLENGFTIKDGCDDLKPYVYAAARAIVRSAIAAAMPADAASEAEALRVEVEQLRKDAERYRWLNGPESEWEPFETAWLSRTNLYGGEPEDMDAVIDSAIAASKPASAKGGE